MDQLGHLILHVHVLLGSDSSTTIRYAIPAIPAIPAISSIPAAPAMPSDAAGPEDLLCNLVHIESETRGQRGPSRAPRESRRSTGDRGGSRRSWRVAGIEGIAGRSKIVNSHRSPIISHAPEHQTKKERKDTRTLSQKPESSAAS
ncbi:unnamed protein product, partial [Trichogramma brassicae]